jgi:hypothetical protein
MMSSISVEDVFSKKFSTVSENDALSKCLGLFKKSVRYAKHYRYVILNRRIENNRYKQLSKNSKYQ